MGNSVKPYSGRCPGHFHNQQHGPEFIGSKVIPEADLIGPNFLEQEGALFQRIQVEAATKAAFLQSDPFDHGTEDTPGLFTLPDRNPHPEGRTDAEIHNEPIVVAGGYPCWIGQGGTLKE